MAQTFYFYDTETSGIRASTSRIMQFAGRRTTLSLEPVGEPDDILIKLTNDILPDPEAVLVHGVTPQQTLQDGVTEAEFARYFIEKIATPDTIFVGFNTVRFDDEFVRYLLYRNFYEPYEWQWKDGRSKWDIMDPLRMMRALRPEGIQWPFDDKGKPTVRLELITKHNNITHTNAHTALADVDATIAVAKLMQQSQPKLFSYLLENRHKKNVAAIVESGVPYVYTSGKYAGDYLKTSLVTTLFKHPKRDAAIVYDLRHDPRQLMQMSTEDLTVAWKAKHTDDTVRLPIKTIMYNRCPAIAPQSVLDQASIKRLQIDIQASKEHLQLLQDNPEFIGRLSSALGILEDKQSAMHLETEDVDTALYESFWSHTEKQQLENVRSHAPATLGELLPKINNKRLKKLLPLYKARNYPSFLLPEEYDEYEIYRQNKLLGSGSGGYEAFRAKLIELGASKTSERDTYLLTELHLYAESIVPYID